ncbi:MAG: TIGR03009 domain-containing protein [Planctomycetia bacterium]|nr:TIGR03009 domain-containing protein [Planctomycetia bacterium]
MRAAGFTLAAMLIAVSVGLAQPAVPGQPLPPPAPPAPKADPKLDGHLAEWEKKMVSVNNLFAEITLKRTDTLRKQDKQYTGSVLCMKPNFARMRLTYTANDKDYETFICNGKAVYHYAGLEKTITEFKLPEKGAGVDNLMLDFLAGMKAKDVKERFEITLFKTDEHYVYFDIKPRLGKDQREFKHMRLALYGPGPKTAKFAYLPAQVYMLKPNDDVEQWSFTNPRLDIPGVAAKEFAFVPIKEFKFQQAPPQPGPMPKAPVPPGGAVRPGKP